MLSITRMVRERPYGIIAMAPRISIISTMMPYLQHGGIVGVGHV